MDLSSKTSFEDLSFKLAKDLRPVLTVFLTIHHLPETIEKNGSGTHGP